MKSCILGMNRKVYAQHSEKALFCGVWTSDVIF